MKGIPQLWASWALWELLLFTSFWVLYRGMLRLRVSPADRYLALKLAFASGPFLPFLPRLWEQDRAGRVIVASARMMTTMAGSGHSLSSRVSEARDWGSALLPLLALYLLTVAWRLFRVWSSFVRLSAVTAEAEPARLPDCRWPVLVHSLRIPPATVGLFRPRILIPRNVFETVSPEQLRMILRHEEVHIERRDYLFNALRAIVDAIVPLSPFTRALGRHFEADMEISCDELLRARRQIVPRAYGELLLELVSNVTPRPELATGGIFVSNSLISRRITAMKDNTRKPRPLAMAGLFVSLAALFGAGVSASGLEPAPGVSVAPVAASARALHFKVWVKIDSESGKKASQKEMKSRIALNYDETGALVLDNVVVRLTPRRSDGNSAMALQIWDERQQQVIYESVAPMTDSGEVEFAANLTPSEGTYFKFNIGLSYLPPSDDAAGELLHGRITLDVKNMKAGALLRKLAETKKFELVLGEGFPGSKRTTVFVKDVAMSQLFDLVASGTDSRWSVDGESGAPVVRFERKR